ncbi:MAG: hypothetical protein VB078_07065 [Clostridiaceae bacterium]|nr:hypothetical protein [Clostridiaceae bacterium]
MKNTSNIKWIATTAIFIALLVTLQSVTKSMGQYVTGSLVNMVLIMAVLTAGLYSGITVSILSPIFAFILGIGPAFVQLVPFIALGNLVLVLVWGFMCRNGNSIKNMSISLVGGAVLKFLALYIGIIKVAIPMFLSLNEKQIAVISASFSYPQIITACIGGLIAMLVSPTVIKAIKK